jgi:hypothetical protein
MASEAERTVGSVAGLVQGIALAAISAAMVAAGAAKTSGARVAGAFTPASCQSCRVFSVN